MLSDEISLQKATKEGSPIQSGKLQIPSLNVLRQLVKVLKKEANDLAEQIYADFNKERGTNYKFKLK